MAKKKKEEVIKETEEVAEEVTEIETLPLKKALVNFGKVKAFVIYDPNTDTLDLERCAL